MTICVLVWNWTLRFLFIKFRLLGRPVGPKKRVYYQMASSNLSVQEWSEFLSRAGHQDGSGAQVANRDPFVVSQHISWQKAWCLGCQDYVEMSTTSEILSRQKSGTILGGSSGILENTVLAQRRCRYKRMESWTHGIETFCDQHFFLLGVCAHCLLWFVVMTPCLLIGCLHKLVHWRRKTARKVVRQSG